jgi:hypothetical protein
MSLLIGEEQADAISALKHEDDGSEEQWESLAGHILNLPAQRAGCQTGGLGHAPLERIPCIGARN